MSRAQVVVLGAGAIGRELLGQLVSNERTANRLSVCGIVDRSGILFDATGLDRERVSALCERKAGGNPVASSDGARCSTPSESLALAVGAGLSRPILVDATASDTHELLTRALSAGFDAVLANKVPLSSAQRDFDALYAVAELHGCEILHEATVGAGLPVIDTIRKLIDAGDVVHQIEGCPSGTLGFLFGELQKQRTFAAALRDAIAAGYTEPDPRTDLCGLDVARKALILGRQIGFRGDLADVHVDSLVPTALADITLDEFLSRLDELNAAFAVRVERARSTGAVLRYRARVSPTSIQVGLAEVPLSDPMGSLSGTDNQFTFTTERYRTRPLVITGPGAGASVTAGGIHNDLLRLVSRAVANA